MESGSLPVPSIEGSAAMNSSEAASRIPTAARIKSATPTPLMLMKPGWGHKAWKQLGLQCYRVAAPT